MKDITLKNYDLAKPDEIVKLSQVLKSHIAKHRLFTEIQGKAYVHADGWGFAGGLLGLLPQVKRTEKLVGDIFFTKKDGVDTQITEVKWLAEVDIVNVKTGSVIGTGVALCSNKENKKRSFDEYAILSMAQTRALGKAYRNTIGWVMKLSGYETTPAEEMSEPIAKDDQFDKAVKMVGAMTSQDALNEYRDKMTKGKTFTNEQKDRMSAIIAERIIQLENETS